MKLYTRFFSSMCTRKQYVNYNFLASLSFDVWSQILLADREPSASKKSQKQVENAAYSKSTPTASSKVLFDSQNAHIILLFFHFYGFQYIYRSSLEIFRRNMDYKQGCGTSVYHLIVLLLMVSSSLTFEAASSF